VNRYNIIFIIGIASAVFILEGCSGSSPRFKSKEKRTSSAPQKQGPRFSSKEAEEEIKETDKKPDRKGIENIAKGNRDFREEKNEAIKPLDESRMMREISKYMGVSYLHGGLTIEGIDCSGYTMMVYKNSLNIELPRSSYEQSKIGKPVEFSELKFGDLIFFNTTGENASHVGIYLGDDLFAHASVSLGVTISSLQSSYYEKRYECARRIVKQ
jgi:cell wall-associated NlpC family hydrolase